MKANFIIFILLFLLLTSLSFSQSFVEKYNNLGEMLVEKFVTAPFPHPGRINGHTYGGRTFTCQEHYTDSSVAVFIPKGFNPSDSTNIVVYFHGWYSNIESSCNRFSLIEQFSESNKNAVFVFPEGPKNSPDSFGGKLEDKNGLRNLLTDVIQFLMKKEKINSDKIGSVILAGHSGAYRVISFCLMHGGLTNHVSDVLLFDALYGQTEKYLQWVENFKGRFINIYTDSGGTKSESEKMMTDLDARNIPYFRVDELELQTEDLLTNRLIFIHTDLSHNEVVYVRKQLYNYLKTSELPAIKK